MTYKFGIFFSFLSDSLAIGQAIGFIQPTLLVGVAHAAPTINLRDTFKVQQTWSKVNVRIKQSLTYFYTKSKWYLIKD